MVPKHHLSSTLTSPMEQQVNSVCSIYYVLKSTTAELHADSRDFIQSVENLTFFDGTSKTVTKQCYNLTLVNDIQCEYFTNCTSVYLLSQLTTNSDSVKLGNNEVPIFIEEDLTQCGMLILLLFFAFKLYLLLSLNIPSRKY